MNNKVYEAILKKAKEIEPYVIELRRNIHMHPELKYEEFKTSQLIIKELESMDIEYIRVAETGVIGVIKGKGERVVALRADMDALPIQEENDVPYRSKVPGKMHACGHDAHVAMLLGAARLLSNIREHINGIVKLIFQPAEEGGAGAKKVVEEGHLNDVDAIFNIHVWSDLPAGTIATRKGPLLASSDVFSIRIKGVGGHGMCPHLANDPTNPASDIYNAIHKIISRNIDPLSSAVITTPFIDASKGHNIIPEVVEIRGTLATFDMRLRDKIMKRIEKIVKSYANAWDCEGIVTLLRPTYPPVINSEELVEVVKDLVEETSLGPFTEAGMSMVGDDFSFYLQKTSGVYVLLGVRNVEKGLIYPHHHPRFDIDENVLWKGVALHCLFTLTLLSLRDKK